MSKRIPFVLALLSLNSALFWLFIPQISAESQAAITVTTTTDELNSNGQCSLREAITNANNDDQSGSADCISGNGIDSITLAAATYQLTLASTDEDANLNGDLDITSPIILTGDGQATTFIQAGSDGTNGIDRVFHLVGSNADLTIADTTIRFGQAGNGAGIFNDGGTLQTNDVTIATNTSVNAGGGIWTRAGTTTLTNSLIDDNHSQTKGGGGLLNTLSSDVTLLNTTVNGNFGPRSGAGINSSDSILTIENSTISNNTVGQAIYAGGGMQLLNASAVTILNSTISGNHSQNGSAIQARHSTTVYITNTTIHDNNPKPGEHMNGAIISRDSGGENAFVYLFNSILGDNHSNQTGQLINCNGQVISHGYNLTQENGTCQFSEPGDQGNVSPLLDPLADNGGATQTHALQTSSPAIDSGSGVNCPASDQRGMPRPMDGDSNGSVVCDKGAFEVLGPTSITLSNFTHTPSTLPSIYGLLFFIIPATLFYLKRRQAA